MTAQIFFLVRIDPPDDEYATEYRLFATHELAWAFITDWVRRGWGKDWHKPCPKELTPDDIWDYFSEADEYIYYEPIDLETTWEPA